MEIRLDPADQPLPPFMNGCFAGGHGSVIEENALWRALGSSSAAASLEATESSTVTSESSSSEAVVSLYNSWSTEASPARDVPLAVGSRHLPGASLAPMSIDNDDALFLPEGFPVAKSSSIHPLEALSSYELLQRLQKRLRPEDIPTVPVLKRRKRPTCSFLNYMGKARVNDYQQRFGVKFQVGMRRSSMPPDGAIVSPGYSTFLEMELLRAEATNSIPAEIDMGLDWVVDNEGEKDEDWFRSMPLVNLSAKATFGVGDQLMSMDEDFAPDDADHHLRADAAAVLELELESAPEIVVCGPAQ